MKTEEPRVERGLNMEEHLQVREVNRSQVSRTAESYQLLWQ